MSLISNDFNIKTNKTKFPPVIPDFLNYDQLFSLIIGFIDGDGSISKKGQLRIKCDISWKNILSSFYHLLTGEHKEFNKTSDGCSIMYICKKRVLYDIKSKSILLGLPLMKRKWDRIKS